jgi:DNA-binding NarL/FixJ family response regulator
MIKVLLADDHQLMRQGVRRILESEPDTQVVGEASDGLEVQKMAADLRPDVILMDVSMGLVDGISATRQLLRQSPG